MCVALLVALSSIAHAGNPLDEPPFTAKPADLLAAAKAMPAEDDGVVVLRHDEDIAFDDRGLVTRRSRWVYLITSEDGLEDWGAVGHVWRPWSQKRPTIRARVISPSGRVSELDPSKITDVQHERLWYTSAELPGAQPGCVVEDELTFVDTAPAPGGRAAVVEITADARVTMSAPVALHAHVVTRGLPAKLAPRHAVAAGRETWTYRFEHHVATARENDEPDDHYTWPVVAITTAPSWSAVAKAYASAVEPHLALALPAELTRGATRENAAAITSWLHAHVKFTGVDLTDAPIDGIDLPAVLRRGDANANELAGLLVALLRAAGFAPEIVLVNRGWRVNLDRDRPALSSFDHVLVRVPLAGGELWIDPEDQDAIVGQLDGDDQGKLALAVTRGALVTVPAMPAANAVREVRTFTLAQLGRGDLREVSHEGGSFESGQRSWVRERDAATVRKRFEKYVRDAYDGTLATFTTTPPADLKKPFEITLDVRGTKRAYTDWSKAGIYLDPAATFGELPWALTAKDVDTRMHDLVIHVPHVYEIENRIVLPDGFSLPKPATDRTRAIGPFKLIERQRTDGAHTLVVTYRLEATATRLTPAQVEDAREAIAQVRRDDPHFVFDNTGWSLIMHGKFREGLAELDRLVAANPSSGLHRARRAQALIYVGAGDAARREARKAVEVDPKNADAYVALGWVLTHDLAGRRWTSGHDHAGARAALLQARKLDPKHLGAAVELASVLERDDHGGKYGPGADLRGAAEAWRAANSLVPTPERGLEVARTLFYAGDAAGAEKAARALDPSPSRDPLLVAAIALSRGADAAIAEAPANDRERVLHDAARLLSYTRHYELMRKVLAALSLRAQGSLEWAQNVQRVDKPFKPTNDPRGVALALALYPLVEDKPRVAFWDAKVAADMLPSNRAQAALPDGMTMALVVDMLRSTSTIRVAGDANAWRIELDMNGNTFITYAARDRGITKVIGAPYARKGVGAHVLRLIGKHDDAAARLLDWFAQDAHVRRDFDKLWGGSLPRDRAAQTLAATWLLDDPARDIAAGTTCGATTEDGQLACGRMVARGDAALHKWDDLLGFATAWASRSTAVDPLADQIAALIHLGRTADAEHALATALAKHPDDVGLLELRAQAGVGHVSSSELVDRLDAIVRSRPSDGRELNQVAWMKLTWGVDLPGALYDVKRSVDLEKESRAAANTLAAIEAERGELRDAVKDIQHAVELAGVDEPAGADWYVLGRIYELAGLRDDAIAAYQRFHTYNPDDLIVSTGQLAAKRLEALGVKH
jgi:tetratricopeptide (TPR) repeat protein